MFVVLGTTTVDLFFTGVDRIPVVGDDEFTSESSAFLDDPTEPILGGNGANSAFALARLGAPTALCSVVGDDLFGEIAVRWLSEQQVDLRGLIRGKKWSTASTAVIMDRTLRRLSLHHAGGAASFRFEDVPSGLVSEAEVLLVTGYHLLPQFRPDGFGRTFSLATLEGALVALDIGPAVGQLAGPAELEHLLPNVDYLIANEFELAACMKEENVDAAARRALLGGASNVVVKRGAAGSSLIAPNRRYDAAGFDVEIAVTVGAGDAFNAGFLFSANQGADPGECLRFANAVAALVASTRRGVLATPDRAAVAHLLSSRP